VKPGIEFLLDSRGASTEIMEVLLNTIWLVVAIAAVGMWLATGYAGVRHHPGKALRFLALVCALILLFPSISLTDDLHEAQAVMEESSRAVMKARAVTEACLRAGRSTFPAILTGLPFGTTALRALAAEVVPLALPAACFALIRPCEGRSPPSA
jgi:hypothetical protein